MRHKKPPHGYDLNAVNDLISGSRASQFFELDDTRLNVMKECLVGPCMCPQILWHKMEPRYGRALMSHRKNHTLGPLSQEKDCGSTVALTVYRKLGELCSEGDDNPRING